MNRTTTIASLAAFGVLAIMGSPAFAQAPAVDGRSQVGARHGGVTRDVGNMTAESLLHRGGIKLYLYNSAGELVPTRGVRGVVTLAVAGNAKRYRYQLFPAADGLLSASVDLSKIMGRQVELQFQTVGLKSNSGKRDVSYREVATVPAEDDQQVAAAIARQKLCPVSGKFLGSMGQPVRVDLGGQKVFVCCAGCVNEVKANPLKYASGRPQIRVTSATKADEPLIQKQAKCPVMDESLGSMGPPIKVQVGKQPIFLCCKGCIKKVQAEPAKYLAMVSNSVAKVHERDGTNQHAESALSTVGRGVGEQVRPGIFRVTQADAKHVAAQKRCPVMDEPLDAMGGPYRVEADGKAIYICCPGCAKKIFAEPKTYLDILAKQGVAAPLLR